MRLAVNGVERQLEIDPATPLLYALRNDLGLVGSRFGCGLGLCGACNVLVDGRVATSCDVPVGAVANSAIVTVEDDATFAGLRAAFAAEQAGQCGYCLSGILVTSAALLAADPDPDERAVRDALDGNLCRCGAHNRIVAAVLRAARER